MPQKTDNIWISLLRRFYRFFTTAYMITLGLITGKEKHAIYEDLRVVNKEIPRLWLQHRTGIGLGRSIIIALLYLFQKHVYFHEKK